MDRWEPCCCKTHCSLYPNDIICKNNHEEADSLMIWHSVYATEICPFAKELCIFSPDTDVLVLLIMHFPKRLTNTFIKMNSGKYDINKIFTNLGMKASALGGIHSLTGCDTVGEISFLQFVLMQLDFKICVFYQYIENLYVGFIFKCFIDSYI